MERVTRIRIEVETVDKHGVVAVHSAEGEPVEGSTLVKIDPRRRTTNISRTRGILSSEVVEVTVHIETVLGRGVQFRVTEEVPAVLRLVESREAIES